MRIDYSKSFIKKFKKSPNKIKIAFRNRSVLFIKNKTNPILNNHALTGKYSGSRSINVTGDWRAIFREFEIDEQEVILFELLDTHSELYG